MQEYKDCLRKTHSPGLHSPTELEPLSSPSAVVAATRANKRRRYVHQIYTPIRRLSKLYEEMQIL